MTTLKPQLIRADTIDLQNQKAPSAKDHSRQPAHPAPLGDGPAAPHQNQTLRHAEQEAIQEQLRSPHVSHNPNEQGFYDDDDNEDGEYDGQNGSHDEDGDYGDQEGEDGMDDDMMDKISSSPSIDDEDIDFEFVYALHTFVATVEGQANATKGDTMVLLDDSNSYWWLVRVVKDGSIGYLPAEHIETPTERLARLNKHRNIDLSATMLGDNPEKSKNPLKKAMRRRNAKQVQFAPPTYHEAEEIDWSDEEEGTGGEGEQDQQAGQTEAASAEEASGVDGTSVVEPLSIKTSQPTAAGSGIKRVESSDSLGDRIESPEKERTSDELFDRRDETVGRSRNGVVRNTDSFFKDDTAETKKISLTPRLLRGDSDVQENPESPQKLRASLEEKLVADADVLKGKDDKKKKEKKPGVLSGLFKRKDKKGKVQGLEEGDFEKVSDEMARASPQPRDSNENLVQEAKAAKPEKAPTRQPSKLQKAPPASMSPKMSPTKDEQAKDRPISSHDGPQSPTLRPTVAPLALRNITSSEAIQPQQTAARVQSPEARERAMSPHHQQAPVYGPQRPVQAPSALASSPTEPSIRRVQNVEEDEDVTPPASQQPTMVSRPTRQDQPMERQVERLSESPVEVPSAEQYEEQEPQQRTYTQPPGLIHDASSSEERPSVSPVSPSLSSIRSDMDHDREGDHFTPQTTMSPQADPHSPATTHSTTPSWSDAHLRTYMENDDDIRDLMIIVHDKSNVVPAGPDHPVTGSLFGSEKNRLAEMQSNLDNMLTGWLARKNGSQQLPT